MTRYLVTDRTTDVVIEENMFYKCRKNYYYYGNSDYRKIIETIIILEIIVIGIGRTAITIYSWLFQFLQLKCTVSKCAIEKAR